MGKLERLKVLYKERYLEHHDIDAWNEAIEKEWPKILAVVEAAKRQRDSYDEEYKTSYELDCALDALDITKESE